MPFSVVNKRNARIFDPVNRAVQFVGFEGLRPLFSAGQPGHWPDSYDPALGRLFQDAVGITPVTAPGQPVGLVLDLSMGGTLGAELFSGVPSTLGAGWVNNGNGTFSIDGSQGATSDLVFPLGLVSGKYYRVTYTVTGGAGSLRAQVGASGLEPFSSARGERTLTLQSSNVNLTFQAGAGVTGTISVVSIRHVPGNHASQATALSRPTLGRWPKGGRRNLLTWTEDFSNAVWVKDTDTLGTATAPVVTPNYGLAPDGSTSASRVVYARGSGGGNASRLHSPGVTMSVGQRTQWSVWVKNTNPGPGQTLRMSQSGAAAKVITVTNDWTRFVQEWPSTTAGFWRGRLDVESFVTGETADVMIWGGQLEFGSVATPYQRVTTDFDITEAGVPSVSHLYNDGGDSLPITLPAGTYGRARVNASGAVTVDTVVNPADALVSNQQVDVILRQGAFTPEEEAKIRAYWARYAA